MPFFEKSEDWLQQSSLLLEARPRSTKVTTKYKISKPKPARPSKSKKPTESADAPAERVPVATLVLRTYDPVSGVCLQYKTRQQAEVGRLIASLGKLGRHMAALPVGAEPETQTPAEGAMDVDEAVPAKEEAQTKGSTQQTTQQSGGGGGGGGGKKKKKGKK